MDERRVRLGVWLAAAVVGIAAVAFGVRCYVGPALGWRERLATLRAAAKHEQRTVAAGETLVRANAELEVALVESVARVPAEARLDAFIADAGRTARAHRVRITALQPGDVTLEGEARFLPVQVVVEGDFQHIYAWMVALETGQRLVRVDRLRASLQTGASVRAELRAQLFLRTQTSTGGG